MVLPTSTTSPWLRKDDLAWFLEYLADEVGPHRSQGVAQIQDCGDDEQPNCEAQDVYMEWDFEGIVKAKWVQGRLKGKTVKCNLSAFTEDKWALMGALHTYGVSYAEATALQLKQAAWHYLEAHCVEVNTCAQQCPVPLAHPHIREARLHIPLANQVIINATVVVGSDTAQLIGRCVA